MWSSRYTVEDCRVVAISTLKKQEIFYDGAYGIISWGTTPYQNQAELIIKLGTNGYIRFRYGIGCDEDRVIFDYSIHLTTTSCYFGGVRYWFMCNCGKRVGAVYLPPNARYFACRHCYGLTYNSRSVNRRSSFYSFIKLFNGDEKAEKLREEITRPYYRGLPTKKLRRLYKLDQENAAYINLLTTREGL